MPIKKYSLLPVLHKYSSTPIRGEPNGHGPCHGSHLETFVDNLLICRSS